MQSKGNLKDSGLFIGSFRVPSPPIVRNAEAVFSDVFGGVCGLRSFAPGRAEILGNHTDYNEGLVLGVAIDRHTAVVGRPTAGTSAVIHAAAFGETDTIDLAESTIDPGPEGQWRRYTRGVLWAMRSRFPRSQGFEAVVTGDLPLGAGLSSSASLQVALGLFVNALHGETIPDDAARMELAKRLRRAENGFVGVASGLLDFVTVLFGRPGHAVFLDCRTLEVRRPSLGERPPAIVILDSATSRKLADGMYNIRRSECERIVDHFRKLKGVEAVQSLRDVTLEELSAGWKFLDPVGRLRARHVLLENVRVAEGVAALDQGDLEKLGLLVSRSHKSSRGDFGNSSDALDALVAAALTAPGCLGAKLSGAGWAGCVVALVRPEAVDDFVKAATASYREQTGLAGSATVAYASGCSDA
jgi:galactokinase